MNRIKIIIILILIFTLAFLLRSRMYFSGDFYYFLDQARDLLLTKEIVINHKLTLIGARSGIGGIFHGPIWLYMIVPFFLIANGNPFYTLIPLFTLVNISIIILAYLLFLNLYDKKTACIFALLLTLSFRLIQTSLFTSNAQVMPILFLLYLYCSIRFLRGKDIYFSLGLFIIGLSVHFESAFAVFLFPLTIIVIVLRKKTPKIRYVFSGIFLFLLSIVNFILFDVRHQFLMTKVALNLLKKGVKPLEAYKHYVNIAFRIQDRLTGLIKYFTLPLFEQNFYSVLLLILIIILSIFLIINKKLKNKNYNLNQKEYLFVSIIPFVYYFLYIFYPIPLWDHYTLALVVSASLYLTYSIRIVWDFKNVRFLVLIFVLAILISPLNWIYINYFSKKNSIKGSYKNQLEVAEYIYSDAKGKQFGYFVYDPASLTYNMDYLIWYLGYSKHTFNASSQKLETIYLVIYPPQSWDLGAPDYWKKNVIRTQGAVISRRKFNDNIVVEKIKTSKKEPQPDPNYFQNIIFR